MIAALLMAICTPVFGEEAAQVAIRAPQRIIGEADSPAVVSFATLSGENATASGNRPVLYDAEYQSLITKLKEYKVIYGVGQIVHGTYYILTTK